MCTTELNTDIFDKNIGFLCTVQNENVFIQGLDSTFFQINQLDLIQELKHKPCYLCWRTFFSASS